MDFATRHSIEKMKFISGNDLIIRTYERGEDSRDVKRNKLNFYKLSIR
jgi:hypothetical protein